MSTARHRSVSHRRHQLALPGIDATVPLTCYQQASGIVGELFELVTAAMVRGYRQAVLSPHGDNPDIVNAAGRTYESKAAGRDRWLLEAEQCYALEQTPHANYVLWRYQTPGEGGLCALGTAGALRAWLATVIRGCYVLPATFPRLILAGTPHAEPRHSPGAGRVWGSNYWFRWRYLREILDGERRLPRRYLTRTWTADVALVAGIAVPPFTVTRFFPIRPSPAKSTSGCPRCGRLRQPPCETPTDDEQSLARAALAQLERERLHVVLAPAPRKNFPGHKIRVADSHNPEWYRVLAHRRPLKPKGKSHSIRAYVRNALRSIIGGCIRTCRAMDREVLDALEEHWEQP